MTDSQGSALDERNGTDPQPPPQRGPVSMHDDENALNRTLEDLVSRLDCVSLEDREMLNEEVKKQLDAAGISNILIITGLPEEVFDDEQAKAMFESVILAGDTTATFQYLKSFRRARVLLSSSIMAARIRQRTNESDVCGKIIKCFFAQPILYAIGSSPTLHPPKPDRQFLISPPASPPVGWEPVPENQPVINFDLISAIANLAPGESHEIHPPSDSQPGIVVHVCEDPEGYATRPQTIQQTRRPQPS